MSSSWNSVGYRAILIAVVASMPLGVATHDHPDDAGSGADAPDEKDAALVLPAPVNTSLWTGNLPPGDPADWYFVAPRPDSTLHLYVDAPSTTIRGVYAANGTNWTRDNFAYVPLPSNEGGIFIGLSRSTNASANATGYYLYARTALAVDLSVNAVTLETARILAFASPFARVVSASLTNEGPHKATGSVSFFATGSVPANFCSIGGKSFALGAGETKDVSIAWDTTGTSGSLRIFAVAALALNLDDTDYTDNSASTNATLNAPTPGVCRP